MHTILYGYIVDHLQSVIVSCLCLSGLQCILSLLSMPIYIASHLASYALLRMYAYKSYIHYIATYSAPSLLVWLYASLLSAMVTQPPFSAAQSSIHSCLPSRYYNNFHVAQSPLLCQSAYVIVCYANLQLYTLSDLYSYPICYAYRCLLNF